MFKWGFVLQDMKKFEGELRNLQAALEQAQAILTSPEVGRLSLKEQLSHRQVTKKNLGWTGVEVGVFSHGSFCLASRGSDSQNAKTWVWPGVVEHTLSQPLGEGKAGR